MKPEHMPKADFVASILLMAFGLWIVLHSLQMPRFENLGANPFSVPGIVPGILGIIIFLLSLVIFVRSLRNGGYRLGIGRRTATDFFQNADMQRMLLTTVICTIYGLLMIGNLNYYLATFGFVLAFLLLFQYRPSEGIAAQLKLLFASVLQAGLTAAVVGAVFRYLFLVDLP
jgi:hypothetical protein